MLAFEKNAKKITQKSFRKTLRMISICFLLRLSKYILKQVKIIVCCRKSEKQLSILTVFSDFVSFNLIF